MSERPAHWSSARTSPARRRSIRCASCAPIAKLIDVPLVIVANPAVGPKSIKEMIERSKTTPGGITFGSTGTNSGQHLTMELLKKATGANLVHVAYRGSAPAVTDLVGGQIPLAVVDLTSAHPHIKAGTLIALAVPHTRRTAMAPEIPTVAEAGVPGFGRIGGFIGMFAPAGTPAPLVKRAVAGGRSDPRRAAGPGQGPIAVGGAGLHRRRRLRPHAGRGIGEMERAAAIDADAQLGE